MPGYVTIKTNFNVIFNRNIRLKRLVQDVVTNVTPILVASHLFAAFHVTRLLEAGQSLGKLDQTFFNRCTAITTKATEGSQPFDHLGLADPRHPKHHSEDGQQFTVLTASLLDFDTVLPDDHDRPKRPAVFKDVSVYCTIIT